MLTLGEAAGIEEEAPMLALPLAVEIADAISTAHKRQWPLDVETTADYLLRAHPEAGATRADIADTLRTVGVAAGVSQSTSAESRLLS